MSKEDLFLKRFVANITAKKLPNEALKQLVFGQQNFCLQQFFINKHGQSHTIPLPLFPHYLFLMNNLDNPYTDTNNPYDEYLQSSWAYQYMKGHSPNRKYCNTKENRKERIREFVRLYESIAERKYLGEKVFKLPIKVCRRPDGRLIIVSGNHRASIALKLGIDIRMNFINPHKHLRNIVEVPEEFYGTKRKNMPYQSVFDGETHLVKGRRPDVLERIRMLDEKDLQNKSILDLGCNIGSNCYLAVQFGARCAVGIDCSPQLINAAVKLNSYFALPCIFAVHDLNRELNGIEPADTVFCFSLVSHLKDRSELVQTILKKTKSILYFEGHQNTKQNDYDYLLNRDYFSSIELLGYTRDGIHNEKKTRPLFRCTIAK